MGGEVEMQITPASDDYDRHDARWLAQVSDLTVSLDRVGEVRRSGEAREGTKGVVSDLVLAVSTLEGLTAALEQIRSWLSRDRSRHLVVRFGESGEVQEVDLTGNVSLDDVELVVEMRKRLSGGGGTPS